MGTVKQFLAQYEREARKAIREELDNTAKIIEEQIQNRIDVNFYGLGYHNNGWLEKSLTTRVRHTGSNFEVQVFFDNKRLAHTSIYGSESLGIVQGEKVYTAQWISDGWTFVNGSHAKRLRDIGYEPNFIEDVIKDDDVVNWQYYFRERMARRGIELY